MKSNPKARVKMPSATSIVARSFPDHFIGVDNRLPWHLRTDLQHFKRRTAGHAIIMGRKTFESLGRPLPNRLNIVLSRQSVAQLSNVIWVRDPETALLCADIYSICNLKKQFFVIGGEIIYREFERYINRVWLTDVFTGPMNGDARFDYEFTKSEWRVPYEQEFPSSEHDDFGFRISFLMRKKERHRQRSREEFLRSDPSVVDFLEEWQRLIESEPSTPPASELQLSLFDGG